MDRSHLGIVTLPRLKGEQPPISADRLDDLHEAAGLMTSTKPLVLLRKRFWAASWTQEVQVLVSFAYVLLPWLRE
jgi:hypothetical protein